MIPLSPSPSTPEMVLLDEPNTVNEDIIKPLTILVVDDSESSRKMITRLLTISGHDCYEARDGNAAVNMISMSEFRGSKSESDGDKERGDCGLDSVTVDVVLMDNHMPGMTGTTHSSALLLPLLSFSLLLSFLFFFLFIFFSLFSFLSFCLLFFYFFIFLLLVILTDMNDAPSQSTQNIKDAFSFFYLNHFFLFLNLIFLLFIFYYQGLSPQKRSAN